MHTNGEVNLKVVKVFSDIQLNQLSFQTKVGVREFTKYLATYPRACQGVDR
jgi:hypothetical protein